MPSVTRISPTTGSRRGGYARRRRGRSLCPAAASRYRRSGPPRHRGHAVDRFAPVGGALVDHHHLDLHALLAQPRRLGRDPRPRPGTSAQRSRRPIPARASSSASAPITPTRTPLTRKTVEGVDPVRRLAGRRLDDIRRQEREVRALLCAGAAARCRNRTRGCRTPSRPVPQAFSTSIAGMSWSSAEFGGEAPTLSPPASSSALAGQRGRLLVEQRRELPRAADASR